MPFLAPNDTPAFLLLFNLFPITCASHSVTVSSLKDPWSPRKELILAFQCVTFQAVAFPFIHMCCNTLTILFELLQ